MRCLGRRNIVIDRISANCVGSRFRNYRVLLLGGLLLLGCSRSDPSTETPSTVLKGKVTLDGAPVEIGQVRADNERERDEILARLTDTATRLSQVTAAHGEELAQLRADAARERDELRAALESRAQVLEESRNELRGRAEGADFWAWRESMLDLAGVEDRGRKKYKTDLRNLFPV